MWFRRAFAGIGLLLILMTYGPAQFVHAAAASPASANFRPLAGC